MEKQKKKKKNWLQGENVFHHLIRWKQTHYYFDQGTTRVFSHLAKDIQV